MQSCFLLLFTWMRLCLLNHFAIFVLLFLFNFSQNDKGNWKQTNEYYEQSHLYLNLNYRLFIELLVFIKIICNRCNQIRFFFFDHVIIVEKIVIAIFLIVPVFNPKKKKKLNHNFPVLDFLLLRSFTQSLFEKNYEFHNNCSSFTSNFLILTQ